MNKKILFISHNATRSGAPIYLLGFIKWLNEHYKLESIILLKDGGELQKDFECIGKTYNWSAHFTSSNTVEKVLSKIGVKKLSISYQNRIKRNIISWQPDFVFSNTIVSNELTYIFKQILNCPFVAVFHEMLFSAQFYYPNALSKSLISIYHKIIAINSDIKKYLVNDFAFEENNIKIISPFIVIDDEKSLRSNQPKKKFEVLLSGFPGWQKGFDLLSNLIANLKYKHPNVKVKFIWLGEVASNIKLMFIYELDKIEANHYISFAGNVSNMSEYYSSASLFLSLSREDTFPTACIEAASYGLPVIAFEKSGGIVDFISNGVGYTVPFLDVDAIASKISFLYHNKFDYNEMVEKSKLLSEQYVIARVAPKIVDVISSCGINLDNKNG